MIAAVKLAGQVRLGKVTRGRLALEVIELADQERPPMVRIPEYLERRRAVGLAEAGSQPAPELEPVGR